MQAAIFFLMKFIFMLSLKFHDDFSESKCEFKCKLQMVQLPI